MSTKKAVFVHSPELEKYSYPPGCPFDISRAGRTRRIVKSMGLFSGEDKAEISPTTADRLTLKKFHTAGYLHSLKNASKGKFDIEALHMGIGNDDCPIFKGMYDYSALVSGASLTGAELIISGEADVVFNPSGGLHHAGPERAAGFCYINDVALACLALTEAGKRVLYLDIDVHHGDGVQGAFYDRSDVMTISFHETGKILFPGTGFEDEIGTGDGTGYSVNVPLPVGTYDEAYIGIFQAIAMPLISSYEADVIVFELGVDTLAGDPLAHLQLTNNTYAEIIRSLLSFDKPILMTGGGGYNIDNTVRAWALAWSVLCGADEENSHEMNLCLGGVMLESTDWLGGLTDRRIVPTKEQKNAVIPAIAKTEAKLKELIFPLHHL